MNPRVIHWRTNGLDLLKSFRIHIWLCTSYGRHFPFGDDGIRLVFQGLVFHHDRVGKCPFFARSRISLPCCLDGRRGLWTSMDILYRSLRWDRLWENWRSWWRCLQSEKDPTWIVWQSQALLSRPSQSLHASYSCHCSTWTCRSEHYCHSRLWVSISFYAPSSKVMPCHSLWLHLWNTLAKQIIKHPFNWPRFHK